MQNPVGESHQAPTRRAGLPLSQWAVPSDRTGGKLMAFYRTNAKPFKV
jgi:hypothetical protein